MFDSVRMADMGLESCLRHPWLDLCFDLRLLGRLHDSTFAALGQMRVLHAADVVVDTVIYLDGTVGATKGLKVVGPAACGFCILHTTEQGEQVFGGYNGAIVPTNVDHPMFLGATKQTNGTVELSATALATMWCLQSGRSRCTLYYDAEYAELMAQALAVPKVNSGLVSGCWGAEAGRSQNANLCPPCVCAHW